MGITYQIEDKGRPAIFLLPVNKLDNRSRERILAFLRSEYGGASHVQAKIIGEWMDEQGIIHRDQMWEFEASFLGKERIPRLYQFLAEIAYDLGEKCVYLKLGQYTHLVYPIKGEGD